MSGARQSNLLDLEVSHPGTISHCASAGCGYRCCDFSAGNYIVLYPGELAAARESDQSVEHLSISPDGCGGHRAVCRAVDTSICDGGYKPLDCASYPFFPTIDHENGKVQTGLKGAKCPLLGLHLRNHARWVKQTWQTLVDHSPELARWITHTRLQAYTPWRRPPAD